MIRLELINQSSVKMPRRFLIQWVKVVEKQLKKRSIMIPEKAELSIIFLDTPAAKKLNFSYRKKDYATDVLSFATEDGVGLGELVICPQVIKRQAKEHSLSFNEECAYMVLHGILHLLGYDHEKNKKQAKAMFSLQDEVFEVLFN